MSDKTFHITLSHGSGRRLDVFLSVHLTELSRAQIQKLITDQKVRLNNTWTKPSHKLKDGDVVEVGEREVSRESGLLPENIPLDIIHSDEHIIVLNKPAGLVVHPGAGVEAGTLVNALIHRFPGIERVGHPERPGIVHRLDKETSGVMVIARSEKAYAELKRQFKAREVEKVYLGLVKGHVQVSDGRIDWALGRHPRHRQRISIRTKKPKAALTLYSVKKTFPDFTLLEIKPVTGRKITKRIRKLRKLSPATKSWTG